MSLVKCKECGNKISSEAKQCPKCGYKKKKIIGFWGVIFILALIGYTSQMFEDKFGSNDKVKSENKSTTSKVSENKINQAGRDALSESTKNNIINTIENNAMVSKAKFGHDEVGGDSSYTIFWIWMPEISGKDYNAIADYFCPVFKVNGLSGIIVSIKKNGTYNTLGRAYCRS